MKDTKHVHTSGSKQFLNIQPEDIVAVGLFNLQLHVLTCWALFYLTGRLQNFLIYERLRLFLHLSIQPLQQTLAIAESGFFFCGVCVCVFGSRLQKSV